MIFVATGPAYPVVLFARSTQIPGSKKIASCCSSLQSCVSRVSASGCDGCARPHMHRSSTGNTGIQLVLCFDATPAALI